MLEFVTSGRSVAISSFAVGQVSACASNATRDASTDSRLKTRLFTATFAGLAQLLPKTDAVTILFRATQVCSAQGLFRRQPTMAGELHRSINCLTRNKARNSRSACAAQSPRP